MEEYVENIFKGFLVQEDIVEAWHYLTQTNQLGKANELVKRMQTPVSFHTSYPWLNESLMAYYRYLQESFIQQFKSSSVKQDLGVDSIKNDLRRRLQKILATAETDMFQLEKKIQDKISEIGWYSKLGKSGDYYAPYIWKKETVQTFQVEMPHSKEEIKVHFMEDFLAKGWLSFVSGDLFSVGAWIDHGEIYCVKEIYEPIIHLPKFQISLLKHETQHQIDHFYKNLTFTRQEYRGKLVELYYYPDTSFLTFLLETASFLNEGNTAAYASAVLLQDLKQYLLETGIQNPDHYLKESIEKPLTWVKNRGSIQQAALALLDRDTQKILH